MKRKFNGAELGMLYAFAFTIIGFLFGIMSYVSFGSTELWVVILAASYIVLFAVYFLLSRIVDSADTYNRKTFIWHSIISLVSVVSVFFIFSDPIGLYALALAICLIPLGYLPPIVHLIVRANRKRNQK